MSGARLRDLARQLEAAADALDRAKLCEARHPDPELPEVRCSRPGGHEREHIGRTRWLRNVVQWEDGGPTFPAPEGPDWIARGWWCRMGPWCRELDGAQACHACYPGPGVEDAANVRLARRDARRQARLKRDHGIEP